MAKKADENKLTAKDRHRINILEYLANPENTVCSRTKLAEVLGITTTSLYQFFKTDELSAVELEALNLRRGRYALKLAQVDSALLERAIDDKDVKAIELVYKKFENWNPNHKIEVSTSDNMTNALAELAKRLPD